MKDAVVKALVAKVRDELAALERVAEATRSEVTSDETRQEGKYDTRATEASYLALGQANRIVTLRQLSAWLDALKPARSRHAALGALVELEGDAVELLFLAPDGGWTVEVEGRRVRVASPASPLGRALLGLEEGDGFLVESPTGTREYEVLGVW